MKKNPTRFYELLADNSPPRALDNACRFIMTAMSMNPPVAPPDLLKPGAMQEVMWKVAKISGWLPVSSKTIQNYASWLGQWRRTEGDMDMLVAIDANLWKEIHATRFATAKTRAQSKFLAITAHEVGHVLMRQPNEDVRFVQNMGTWIKADIASLKAEAQAWLFAGILRAFVFADIGSEKRPDETHRYA